MNIITVKNYDMMSDLAALLIAARVLEKPNSILGFATGSTPNGTYQNLIKMYNNGLVDFSQVKTFNLDEYCGLPQEHEQSYNYYMNENLFKHINIKAENIKIPNGMADDFDTESMEYETAIKNAGGVDLQLLGVGLNGHIGFNEPDNIFHNITREVELTQSTIDANSRFFQDKSEVPKTAISMGIGTIMSAKEIVLLAGEDKNEVVQKLQDNVVSPEFPVSILHYHPKCTIITVNKN